MDLFDQNVIGYDATKGAVSQRDAQKIHSPVPE